MKTLWTVLILVIVAAAIAAGVEQHDAYVILHLAHTQIETSFWIACLTAAVAFIVFYFALRLLIRIFGVGEYLRNRRKIKRARNARELTEAGLLDTLNGRWSSAQNHLGRAAGFSRDSFLPKLLQTFAAQLQGDTATRDILLNAIDTKNPEQDLSLQLTKAQLLMHAGEWEKVLSCLSALRKASPTHPHLVSLHAKACYKLKEWDALANTLPFLKKNQSVSPETLNQWQLECFIHNLKIAGDHTKEAVSGTWKMGSRELQDSVLAKEQYLKSLLALNEYELAKEKLLNFLKKKWQPALLPLLVDCLEQDDAKLIITVDKWAQRYPNEPKVTEALAMLCLKAGRVPRAKEILLQLAQKNPSKAIYNALAKAAAAEEDWKAAAGYYQMATDTDR